MRKHPWRSWMIGGTFNVVFNLISMRFIPNPWAPHHDLRWFLAAGGFGFLAIGICTWWLLRGVTMWKRWRRGN